MASLLNQSRSQGFKVIGMNESGRAEPIQIRLLEQTGQVVGHVHFHDEKVTLAKQDLAVRESSSTGVGKLFSFQ